GAGGGEERGGAGDEPGEGAADHPGGVEGGGEPRRRQFRGGVGGRRGGGGGAEEPKSVRGMAAAQAVPAAGPPETPHPDCRTEGLDTKAPPSCMRIDQLLTLGGTGALRSWRRGTVDRSGGRPKPAAGPPPPAAGVARMPGG